MDELCSKGAAWDNEVAGHVKSMINTAVLARLGMAPIWVEARARRLHALRQAAARSDNQAPATIFG
ncbi:MAG: hypothetical protein ACKPKO_03120, partial [Candidatus Fonsibacter sp.]